MACIDRSSDFTSLAEAHRAALPSPPPPSRIRQKAAIALQAATLAAQIKRAASLVIRLHHLARRRALFDDPAAEINELVPRVKSELQSANSALAEFLSACSQQPGPDPRAVLAHSPRAHWSLVSETLREKAVAVASLLQDALSTRARNLQEHNSRRRQIARSNFVPTLQADSPLWAPLQPASPAVDSESSAFTSTGHRGLRSRRPVGAGPEAPPTSNAVARNPPSAFGRDSAPSLKDSNRAAQKAEFLAPTAYNSAAIGVKRGGNSAGGHAGGGAYSYTAQQVTQYHTASTRLEEQLAVEATVVEVGAFNLEHPPLSAALIALFLSQGK